MQSPTGEPIEDMKREAMLEEAISSAELAHTESWEEKCCEKCLGSYLIGRDTRGCIDGGCPCHKKSIWKKDWYEFCKLGGLHCTEEAQVMQQKIDLRISQELQRQREEMIKKVKEHQKVIKLEQYTVDEIISLLEQS